MILKAIKAIKRALIRDHVVVVKQYHTGHVRLKTFGNCFVTLQPRDVRELGGFFLAYKKSKAYLERCKRTDLTGRDVDIISDCYTDPSDFN